MVGQVGLTLVSDQASLCSLLGFWLLPDTGQILAKQRVLQRAKCEQKMKEQM